MIYIYFIGRNWLKQDWKPSWFDKIFIFKKHLNIWLYSNSSKNFPQMDNDDQRRIEKPVERLRWSFPEKGLQKASS